MTLVLISGGIDLSVGSIVALSSAVIGVVLTVFELPLLVAALIGIAAGGCAGLVNGARQLFPLAHIYSHLRHAGSRSRSGLHGDWISDHFHWPQYSSAFTATAGYRGFACFSHCPGLVFISQLVLTRTVFGRYLIAIGTNEKAARISGIEPNPILMLRC